MSAAAAELWAIEGLWWLAAGVFVAGLVRGFAGFGTAMIYLPVAAQVIPPVWALTTMVVYDLIGPLPNVPRALRDGHPRDVIRLAVGLMVSVPLGVWMLSQMADDTYRIVIAVMSLALLALLIGGFRWRGEMGPRMIYGTGMLGGIVGGATGLAGPPIIMLYMASAHPASVIRANITLYLLLADIAILCVFVLSNMITLTPVLLGIALIAPYMLGTVTGAWLFDPARERLYRWIAYAIIAISAVSGLPFWN